MAEFDNTERLLELHARFNIPACFAIVGAAALPGGRPYHDPGQLRRIHAHGHEIASHSFRHEWLPGLGRRALLETLRDSKDALEQCVGAAVMTFVPPYNQPFDYPRQRSFSLSERREAGHDRVDLPRLCNALEETGYRVCRVGYRPLYQRFLEGLTRRSFDRPVSPEIIAGVTCIRLNTPNGFSAGSAAVVTRCVERGGIAVVSGHPHSLRTGNTQDERWLIPFLQRLHSLNQQGVLDLCLPTQLRLGPE